MWNLITVIFTGLQLQRSLTLMKRKCKPLQKMPLWTDAENQVINHESSKPSPQIILTWLFHYILKAQQKWWFGGFGKSGWRFFPLLLFQDLQPALWKGKLGWTRCCPTWNATAKWRSTSCERVEISSRLKRSWRRRCLPTARRSGRRKGSETATPTPSSPRDRGDTEVSMDEDFLTDTWGQVLSRLSQNLKFFLSNKFCMFCMCFVFWQ